MDGYLGITTPTKSEKRAVHDDADPPFPGQIGRSAADHPNVFDIIVTIYIDFLYLPFSPPLYFLLSLYPTTVYLGVREILGRLTAFNASNNVCATTSARRHAKISRIII